MQSYRLLRLGCNLYVVELVRLGRHEFVTAFLLADPATIETGLPEIAAPPFESWRWRHGARDAVGAVAKHCFAPTAVGGPCRAHRGPRSGAARGNFRETVARSGWVASKMSLVSVILLLLYWQAKCQVTDPNDFQAPFSASPISIDMRTPMFE